MSFASFGKITPSNSLKARKPTGLQKTAAAAIAGVGILAGAGQAAAIPVTAGDIETGTSVAIFSGTITPGSDPHSIELRTLWDSAFEPDQALNSTSLSQSEISADIDLLKTVSYIIDGGTEQEFEIVTGALVSAADTPGNDNATFAANWSAGSAPYSGFSITGTKGGGFDGSSLVNFDSLVTVLANDSGWNYSWSLTPVGGGVNDPAAVTNVQLIQGTGAVATADEEVPEPGALALFGIGLAGLGAVRLRRKLG